MAMYNAVYSLAEILSGQLPIAFDIANIEVLMCVVAIGNSDSTRSLGVFERRRISFSVSDEQGRVHVSTEMAARQFEEGCRDILASIAPGHTSKYEYRI